MANHGIATLQNAAVADGNGTPLGIGGAESVVIQITGSFTATVNFEATLDGSNWIAVACANLNSTTRARATSATAAGLFLLEQIKGLVSFRARISGWSANEVTVKAQASS